MHDAFCQEYDEKWVNVLQLQLSDALTTIWGPQLDDALAVGSRPPLHGILFDTGHHLLGRPSSMRTTACDVPVGGSTDALMRSSEEELECELSAAVQRVMDARVDEPVLELGRQLLVAGALASLFGGAAAASDQQRQQVWAALRRLQQQNADGKPARAESKAESLRRRLGGLTLGALREAYWADRDTEAKALYRERVKEHKQKLEGKERR